MLDMMLFVAVERVEHLHALEVEPDIVLVGAADPAVQLNGLARDVLAPHGELDFRGTHRTAPYAWLGMVDLDRALERDGAQELRLDEHVHGAMLQRLERADFHVELFP